jgi:ribA/ribD-fused uncharacterized protein
MDSINEFRYEYYFLSNFSNFGLDYKGVHFKNSEQAYQWEKAENEEDKLKILQTSSAKEVKALGHKIKCDIVKWDTNKINVMEDILMAKFSQSYLKNRLLATGNSILIEGNYWHDNYWGSCYCYKCEKIDGQNILGKILMKVRTHFRD